jgi:cytidylate kinase
VAHPEPTDTDTRIVAISASYGSAGSRIAPALAERLGVPFVDRALRVRGPDQVAAAAQEDTERDEQAATGWLERMLRGFVGAEAAVPGPVPTAVATDAEDLRRGSEALLLEQAARGRGVILGRAAVVVLREDPRVLRVRLDGPPERRIEQAVRLFGADPQDTARAVRNLDRAHDAYLRRFYGADIHDPALYHVTLDTTVLGVEACVEILLTAARSRPRPAG